VSVDFSSNNFIVACLPIFGGCLSGFPLPQMGNTSGLCLLPWILRSHVCYADLVC